jgi:hypothetical protein
MSGRSRPAGARDITLRKPCPECGSTSGWIESREVHEAVVCNCGKWQYFAPYIDTGRKPRTADRMRRGLRDWQRVRCLLRASHKCEYCGEAGILHIAHIVSVADCVRLGLSTHETNHPRNLAVLCEPCNLAVRTTMSFWVILYFPRLSNISDRAGR